MNKDLSKELTVFVITVGNNPNYDLCISALERQTVKFTLNIIKDYFPLSKAFQEMLNRCKTKYYIEVDEDMILYSDSIEKMYRSIKNTNNNIAMISFKLLDIHLTFKIHGIKIYKYNILKKYPYNLKHPSCEIEQIERFKKDGYDLLIPDSIVGKHSPIWNEELIFEHYYNLMEKFKLYGYSWMGKLPNKLWNILQKNPTKINMYGFLGAFSSVFSDKTMNEEKDARLTRRDFMKTMTYFETPTQATIYVTSLCNFKCSFCYREHHIIEKSRDADINTVNQLLTRFPSIQGVCLCGYGETLLSPNLPFIIDTLRKANKTIGLITNGSLLKEKLPLLVDHPPNYISVSLNSHNKELHEEITKTKTFNTVIEGIKLAVHFPIPIYVSSVVTSENIKYVPELLKLVKSLGVKTVHLHNLLPHFDEKNNEKFWGLVLTEKYQEDIEIIKKLPEANIVKKYPVLIEKGKCKYTCQFPWKSIAVNGNGAISICNSVFPCNEKEFGNINNPTIWNSEKCQKFRDDFLNKKIEVCKKCFRNWQWQ